MISFFQSFREFVVKKIYKLPEDCPIFNDFIMKGCKILHQLLTEVRNTLTVSLSFYNRVFEFTFQFNFKFRCFLKFLNFKFT